MYLNGVYGLYYDFAAYFKFENIRSEDRDYLLAIKNHEIEYDDIIAQVESEKKDMETAIANSKLPDKLNFSKINELLIELRKEVYYYNGK